MYRSSSYHNLWPTDFVPILLMIGACLLSLSNAALSRPTTEIDHSLLNSLQRSLEQPIDSFEDRFDAEVWLLDKSLRMAKFIDNPTQRIELLKAIHREANIAQIQPELILALIQVESGFDSYAISRVGAQGLMQVMPFWRKELGRDTDNLTDIDTNLRYGCTILRHYIDRENGKLTPALARYNGSYGKTWYPERVFNAFEYWK